MNIFLWILQVLLAIHTVFGAIWKFINPVAETPLAAIPQSVWIILAIVEIIAAVLLVLPLLVKNTKRFVFPAALFIIAEMILFVIVYSVTAYSGMFQIYYWIITAIIAAIIAWGRCKFKFN